jgi:VWFA-related protein
MRHLLSISLVILSAIPVLAQSGRTKNYSESQPVSGEYGTRPDKSNDSKNLKNGDDVVRVDTDLITMPVRVRTRRGRQVSALHQKEFKIFENGVEQEVAFFLDEEQPFTVALLLDMSYSSVFRLAEIQAAAKTFVDQLRPTERVMVIGFDQRPVILCAATSDRRILNLAINGMQIGSGTALYTALDLVLEEYLAEIEGRRAIVLLSDGVDTSSVTATAETVQANLAGKDILVYPIRYNTFDDVQKTRRDTAPMVYGEDDRPYKRETNPVKGERAEDYTIAKQFLLGMSEISGGRSFNVTSTTNLHSSFAEIADELRKVYSIGYYPSEQREPGRTYEIKIRVYRPNLSVTARPSYVARSR